MSERNRSYYATGIPEYLTGSTDGNQTYSSYDRNEIQSLRNSYHHLQNLVFTLQKSLEREQERNDRKGLFAQEQFAKDFQRKIEIKEDQQSTLVDSLKRQIEELSLKNDLHEMKFKMMEKKIDELEEEIKRSKEKTVDETGHHDQLRQERVPTQRVNIKVYRPRQQQWPPKPCFGLRKDTRNMYFKTTIYASDKYRNSTDQEIQEKMNSECAFDILQELHQEKEMRLGKKPPFRKVVEKGARYMHFLDNKIYQQIDVIDGNLRKVLTDGAQNEGLWIAKECETPQMLPEDADEITEEEFLSIANSENED
ncbi:Oidioi.mRNA.OKI2018_I69.chr2.g4430.t1.cds [Oikopleura dioica]|uniref:Oidioi.mRNA.OKI2018_I69.chr2.g4430.t1.cds n=1 Tax=Oikopleura dioica TaxID=34765 RepID=A0ABN7T2S3_OIKDI|nr:Oidioi.mRNA.OKI2018_I69.chr2.g4430.t1.cds [Oikopleura dioica]